jgi:hypothetical protein
MSQSLLTEMGGMALSEALVKESGSENRKTPPGGGVFLLHPVF